MLKLYIFWGTFAFVLIGIALSLIQQRGSRRTDQAAAAKSGATSAAGELPATRRAEVPFDPKATRIHIRPPSGSAHAALLRGDQATLPDAGSARLVCVGGPQKGSSYPLTVAGIKVGRDPHNDIVIADPRVSYRHAWVGIVDRKVVLRDLGSTNGTFRNAQIDLLVEEVVLSPGDTVFFGGHGGDQFRFVVS